MTENYDEIVIRRLIEHLVTILLAFPHKENIRSGFAAIIASGPTVKEKDFKKYKSEIIKLSKKQQKKTVEIIHKAMDEIRSQPDLYHQVLSLMAKVMSSLEKSNISQTKH